MKAPISFGSPLHRSIEISDADDDHSVPQSLSDSVCQDDLLKCLEIFLSNKEETCIMIDQVKICNLFCSTCRRPKPEAILVCAQSQL